MATVQQPTSSDQEMLSQTETEDTDSGDVPTGSGKTSSESCTMDTSLDSSCSEEITHTSSSEEEKKPFCVSVDLTEVTELEENSSAGEEFQKDAIKMKRNRQKDSRVRNPDLPDWGSSSDWYKHDCFKTYWKHYNQVMSWCRKHFEVCNNLKKRYTPHNKKQQTFSSHDMRYPCQPSWFHPYMNWYTCSEMQNDSFSGNNTRRKKKKQKQRCNKSDCETTCSETQTETSEEFQMEVTPEMLDFFVKTQEHRRQRDEAKKAEMGREVGAEHISVEDLKVTAKKAPTVEAPKERPGAKRTAEMKLLYGKGAAMIHGMETALQMTFDRNTDLKQPKIWPNMPLKIVFK